MTIVEAVVLGLIQGLTEFIPVSSSGHLVIAQQLFGNGSDHLFLEWINIGTVLALIIFFRRRITAIIRQIVVEHDYRVAIVGLIAAIPAGLTGFFLAGFIESNSFFSNAWVVATTLVLLGIVMVVIERLPKLSPVKDLPDLPKSRALTIGLAQVLALIPGTSRSGSTIIAGRLMGFNAARAAEFSFLVSIPIMCGVILKLLVQQDDRVYFADNAVTLLIANVAALVSGLLAVGFLMRYLETRSLAVFGWYRIGLGSLVAVLLLVQ